MNKSTRRTHRSNVALLYVLGASCISIGYAIDGAINAAFYSFGCFIIAGTLMLIFAGPVGKDYDYDGDGKIE